MKRLPRERMLDHLLEAGAPELEKEMARLALFIATMHRRALPPGPRERSCDLEVVRDNWRENFEQTLPFADQVLPVQGLATARRLVGEFLVRQAPLLRQREAQGFVRELHGDLHSEHVCLTDPIQIYDCIEFNRRFRVFDILAELAFLLMDLEFRNRRDLAGVLLKGYLDQGEWGPGVGLLIPFYKAYRAWVRGKVAALAMAQHAPEEDQHALLLNRARRYLNLAMGYLTPQALILTCGLMGTGKTVLARALAAATGALHLRSDAERKERAGVAPHTRVRESFGEGLYAPSVNAATYLSLRDKAERALDKGESVLVDASFAQDRHREIFFRLEKERGVPVVLVHLHCDEALLLDRLRRREAQGDDISDGRSELLASQAAAFDPVDRWAGVVEIDSGLAIDYNVGLILTDLLMKHSGNR